MVYVLCVQEFPILSVFPITSSLATVLQVTISVVFIPIHAGAATDQADTLTPPPLARTVLLFLVRVQLQPMDV